jgi:hypothetical protein
MADESRWRLTPGRWLVLKLGAVPPIVFFIGKAVIFIQPSNFPIMIAIPMGIILFDGLVTRWTYVRGSANISA